MTATLEVLADRAPDARYWTRSSEIHEVGVNFPERTLEVVVMPYERGAKVPWGIERREVTEVISRGAFDGIERRANRIKANRDHDEKRTFGKAISLHPSRNEGLVGKVHVARTALGDETLELAEEGCLDVSAGFQVKPGDLQWETRSRYRVNKAFLVHIALVPDGAYGTDAGVLAVRAQPAVVTVERPAMPHVDAYRLQRLKEQYDAIDARWIPSERVVPSRKH